MPLSESWCDMWCGDDPNLVVAVGECIQSATYYHYPDGFAVDPVCFLEELDDMGWTVVKKGT